MNPAALKANLRDLPPGSTMLVNVDAFDTRNLDKAGYEANPLDDGSLAAFRVYEVPMTSITVEATQGARREAARRRALEELLRARADLVDVHAPDRARRSSGSSERSRTATEVLDANIAAFRAGYNFGETAELFDHPYEVKPAQLRAGQVPQHHRQRRASRTGSSPRAQQAKLPIFYASYPITPASDILHELSKLKNFGVKTLQAEDEIAAAGVAIGAAFAGQLGDHRHERSGCRPQVGGARARDQPRAAAGLVDVQRGGPSTGLPTKTEQADLMLAMYGRHGEAPLPIVAAQSPSHCFDAAFEAVRIALEVPHAGDPAHRRLPRQRRRAVEAPRPRRAARHLGAVRDRAQPRRRVLALPARPRDARPPVGDPGHARA